MTSVGEKTAGCPAIVVVSLKLDTSESNSTRQEPPTLPTIDHKG
jgi:hypothetical protein